ncbi:unnamed protein product [Paramecium octaurelia]|uniref:Uncharacterized protein n=1 Tax=Paramecium octaurelia TaxID=43137 RepID=A0A8S1RYR5_PAROT|nr:unnamed protein product [Paramecium octaurelia]
MNNSRITRGIEKDEGERTTQTSQIKKGRILKWMQELLQTQISPFQTTFQLVAKQTKNHMREVISGSLSLKKDNQLSQQFWSNYDPVKFEISQEGSWIGILQNLQAQLFKQKIQLLIKNQTTIQDFVNLINTHEIYKGNCNRFQTQAALYLQQKEELFIQKKTSNMQYYQMAEF